MRSCIPCSATIRMQHPIPSVSDLKAPQISVSRNMVLFHENSLRKLYLLDLLKSYLAQFKRLGFSILSTPPLKKERHHTPIPTPVFLKIWLGDNSFLYQPRVQKPQCIHAVHSFSLLISVLQALLKQGGPSAILLCPTSENSCLEQLHREVMKKEEKKRQKMSIAYNGRLSSTLDAITFNIFYTQNSCLSKCSGSL